MYDNAGTKIGYGEQEDVDTSSPMSLPSLLEDPLIVIPERHNDYVQFKLGGQAWPSDGDFGPDDVPRCQVGDWDSADLVSVSCAHAV